MKGELVSAALDGTTKVLVETGNFNVRSIKVSNNVIYYITGEDGQLNAYDTMTGEVRQVLKSVEWVIPSNDGTRLAIVKRTADTKRALVLTDLEGNEKATLARGTQILAQAGQATTPRLLIRFNPITTTKRDYSYPTRNLQSNSSSPQIWMKWLMH